MNWPSEYEQLKLHIQHSWSIRDEISLIRKLSGKSSAFVFVADIHTPKFQGYGILKLDKLNDFNRDEDGEVERNQKSLDFNHNFSTKHLPKIVHSAEYNGKIAILSTIAGGGLEYVQPWSRGDYSQQLPVAQKLSLELLSEWNKDYKVAEEEITPSEILSQWLGYRLRPTEGRIYDFMSDKCGFDPDSPTFIFNGEWHPNPFVFANAASKLPTDHVSRYIKGITHGDLHGYNILFERLSRMNIIII